MAVREIDGYPMAYWSCGLDGDQRWYRTIKCVTREQMDDAIDRIRVAAEKAGAFIIWRTRPEEGLCGWYARLITSTPIPEEVWSASFYDPRGTGEHPP